MIIPEELLALILAHLDPLTDQGAVAALRLSNQVCCGQASPLVYRSITANLQPFGNAIDSPSVLELVQQLEAQPRLKGFVMELHFAKRSKAVKIALDERQAYKDDSSSAPVSFRGLELSETLVKGLIQEYEERSEYGSAVYLLTQCTAIESLSFAFDYSTFRSVIRRIVDEAKNVQAEARLSSYSPKLETTIKR